MILYNVVFLSQINVLDHCCQSVNPSNYLAIVICLDAIRIKLINEVRKTCYWNLLQIHKTKQLLGS